MVNFNKIKKNINNNIRNIRDKVDKIKNDFVLFFKEKDKMKKVKKILHRIYRFAIDKKILCIILCAVPFIIMDLATTFFANEINFYDPFAQAPRLFSLGYIVLLLGVIFNINKKGSYYTYVITFALFFILFLVHNVYYDATGNFFGFSILGLAGEGSSYFLDVIFSTNCLVYIIALIILFIFFCSLRYFPVSKGVNKKNIIITIVVFLVIHTYAKSTLGTANFELTWDTWRTPRNIYNNFNDSNKGMAICGLYEYVVRDFYITYIKPTEKLSETENNFLEEVFMVDNNSYRKNSYTGKFKNKNVIFLQLEGIDNWLLTKETMPNTYKLLDNSINFTNHYSFYNGGGSTFNSEFAVNVGYMTPFTYPKNAYSLNKNDFPYSIANLLKNENYSVSAYHMNNSEYYSRGINYQNWGYDRYYGLEDLGEYEHTEYYLDRELILNETFYNKLFKGAEKFSNYIITYSTHLPFTTEKGVCRMLLEKDYATRLNGLTKSEINDFMVNLDMSEEDCIKRQAKETDYMIGLLIKALKDNKLYKDTIIVAFADHYLFTASDEVLDKNKDTSNNLINKTPFFIWSADLEKTVVTKVTSQLNILPTVLNLLGIEYNEKWYVATDALDKNYSGIAIFNDLSWYDGNVYVVDGVVANDKKISATLLEEKNNLVEYLVKKNDLVLKYNYFKEITD